MIRAQQRPSFAAFARTLAWILVALAILGIASLFAMLTIGPVGQR